MGPKTRIVNVTATKNNETAVKITKVQAQKNFILSYLCTLLVLFDFLAEKDTSSIF